MTKDDLVRTVKQIVALGRAGQIDETYAAYSTLFSDPDFMSQRAEDQRQALKLMVLWKNSTSNPTPMMLAAHEAALVPLTELVSMFGEPADHELLGICHLLLGHEQAASSIFRAALAVERERNPQSDLCGNLMKRISLI